MKFKSKAQKALRSYFQNTEPRAKRELINAAILDPLKQLYKNWHVQPSLSG